MRDPVGSEKKSKCTKHAVFPYRHNLHKLTDLQRPEEEDYSGTYEEVLVINAQFLIQFDLKLKYELLKLYLRCLNIKYLN